MVEAAPPAVRCTAIALGYNVTLGVVGGVSPLAATWLVHRTDNDLSPAFMIMAAGRDLVRGAADLQGKPAGKGRQAVIRRRAFAAGALTAAATVPARTAEPASIDAHAHVFVRGLKLAVDARYAPDYDASWQTLLALAERNGVGRAVILQPSFLGYDNSYLFSALRAEPGRLRGVPWISPSVETTAEEWEEMARIGVGACASRSSACRRRNGRPIATCWPKPSSATGRSISMSRASGCLRCCRSCSMAATSW